MVYATQNPDLSGNQWATNMVYDEDSGSWMEYIKKHPYNDSRVSYGMTALAKEDGLDTLQEAMETDTNWAEVVVPETGADAMESVETPTGKELAVSPVAAASIEPATECTPDSSTTEAPVTKAEQAQPADEDPVAAPTMENVQ